MQTGAAGSRRSDRRRSPLPEPVVAFDPVGEVVVRDNRAATRAATRAAMADEFAARFGLEDVESSAEALADRYGFRYEAPGEGAPARRTITITGRGADRVIAPGREVRRTPRHRIEPIGLHADRIAMYAVLLGLLLAFVAVTSGHALH